MTNSLVASTSNVPVRFTTPSIQQHIAGGNAKINRFSISKHKKKIAQHADDSSSADKDLPNIINNEDFEKYDDDSRGDQEKLTYEDFRLTKENNSDDSLLNSLDSRDKRRHYLIKSKQFLHSGKRLTFTQ